MSFNSSINTQHTLVSSTQVASSHARLALRTTVEGWDAAAAVLMCEEALAAHSGYSLLQVTPTPHLSPNADLHTLLGRKVCVCVLVSWSDFLITLKSFSWSFFYIYDTGSELEFP